MAILRLNSTNLHLDMIVGINEKFEPKESILELNGKAVELKNKVNDFLNTTFNTANVAEINKIMNENKDLENKWKEFLSNVYKPELQSLSEEVVKINRGICNNYSEIIPE